MLLKGHTVLMATLDYLMVAQCASLLHKVVVEGRELLQLPWVRGVLLSSELLPMMHFIVLDFPYIRAVREWQ